jgi:hypothetical protein
MSTTEPRLLTADDITALRTAEDFFVLINARAYDAGVGVIRCGKTLKAVADGPFAAAERTVSHDVLVDVHTTTVATFSPSRHGAIHALALLVRVGDRLTLDARNNNNGYCEQASLFLDECVAALSRTNAKGRETTILRRLVLATSICPGNSARAIKGERARVSA